MVCHNAPIMPVYLVSPAWSKLAQLHLKLVNCDRGPGTEEILELCFILSKLSVR
jgi:hypothetical protein